VVQTRQEKSSRWYVIEITFGDLKPGPHTLTISARDKAGTQGNKTTTSFTVK
jgi:hypothetical protein